MVRAILFDMGGTLDGEALHWLDRFGNLYANAGIALTRERLRAAFDEAERRSGSDQAIASAHLIEMVDRHVRWQFEYLSLDLPDVLREALVKAFIAPVEQAADGNRTLLRTLKDRGLTLGVVSNGCGNVDVLCEDLGYAPYLSLVVDSKRVGIAKPDPAIYTLAAATLGYDPSAIMMVGDSFDRDIRPSKAIGMATAWLSGPAGPVECPDPSIVDIRLRALSELPGALEALEHSIA